MEREELLAKYPRLMALFDEDLDERRFLAVVDANIEEEADETDIFDPMEYNWILYLPERVKEALGEEKFAEIPDRLAARESIESLIMDEEDLFGIAVASEDEEAVAAEVLAVLESLAGAREGSESC